MPQTLGGGEKCPRCDKTVYFAEERRALGRKYHIACLKCVDCSKSLDSTNSNDHDREIYCNACYRKQFGPQGYGFAAGGAGLSCDAGHGGESAPHTTPSSGPGSLGGGEQCPRCQRAVYMAEKVIGAGRSYHKLCFRCQSCSKGLDSTILCQHEENIYCKACYGRLFGPKGYGYAGGASGLSMDTGKANEICRDNVSHLAQAQVPSRLANGGDTGNNEMCARCGGAVFFAERIAGMGKVYHKACFKCSACSKSLDSTLLTQHEDNIYCKACYGKNFGPRGFGYGTAMVYTE
ncbi:cysteine and glycine-rich protein 1-like isoform X2 [Littorina saxatilis]|uniref:LIM zinc-binding domain-containing protein n=1 Tax=Littorina saxatilis TaxID=31220 RepID=A0AAN9B2V4_9CAEN